MSHALPTWSGWAGGHDSLLLFAPSLHGDRPSASVVALVQISFCILASTSTGLDTQHTGATAAGCRAGTQAQRQPQDTGQGSLEVAESRASYRNAGMFNRLLYLTCVCVCVRVCARMLVCVCMCVCALGKVGSSTLRLRAFICFLLI